MYSFGAPDARVYIGATNNVPRRTTEQRSKNSKLGAWIAAHRRAGIDPQPMILGFYQTEIEARAAEARLIQICRSKGHPLLNQVVKEEVIRRLETRAAQRAAQRAENETA